MSELKPTCCHTKFEGFGFNRIKCHNNAKVEREGKHYCGMHDPVARVEKQNKRDDASRAEWKARDAAQAKAQAEQKELERRAGCYPELLEALKINQRLLKNITPYKGQEDLLTGSIELNDLVINKATGEQA
jgi:hypothetical protein